MPSKYNEYHRFLLSRLGQPPLVAVCMNPSAANKSYSDRTINRIINASKKLGYNGWLVANVYPERATNASDLDDFNPDLSEENVQLILEFLIDNGIDEVWGAWGNLGQHSLVKVRNHLLDSFKQNNNCVYSFAPLIKWGQPVHPLNRSVKQNISEAGKLYLDF
ncbi:DUF1643 domain-containing protein [Streptococcus sp. CSL10205-OR2]|uniref:DUF1643 domain-containing protein n=1 Tax=Streptococcus sp. CSL10205-OR2 TaxID=2980558 RepID=UPI0021DB0C44|nr:DUF1643 domain-containing protein [Streptococcus sp. CSL10205-OR2]MCU9533551.1 DUF1643 domain-containing protein [Streptococcus sp. CSL10205-OR2]